MLLLVVLVLLRGVGRRKAEARKGIQFKQRRRRREEEMEMQQQLGKEEDDDAGLLLVVLLVMINLSEGVDQLLSICVCVGVMVMMVSGWLVV